MSPPQKTSHPLAKVAADLNETHEGLGRLFIFSMLACKASKTLLVISPAGTGKSTSSDLVAENNPGSIKLASLTEAGLTPWQEKFTSFRAALVVDDLGRLNTQYRRLYTIATVAELVYSHFAEDHTGHQHLSITDFGGSAIVNCQPVVLRQIIRSGDWEATVADKTLRYYHLRRPLKPFLELPRLDIELGIAIEDVKRPDVESETIFPMVEKGFMQWGEARSRQHISDLLRAAAAFRDSENVESVDIKLLTQLVKPMWVEQFVMDKKGLESERLLATDLLYLITELTTYGKVTIKQLARNYKISAETARRYLDSHPTLVRVVQKKPTAYGATAAMMKLLKEVI